MTDEADEGFTLVEMLVVIVVLGVLATVTVFAVRGITDSGKENASLADERTLVTAEEAHLVLHDSYASEAELVEAGFLRDESPFHDIALNADGSYAIVPVGDGGGGEPAIPVPPPPTVMVPTTYASFSGQSFGSGAHRIVIISNGSSMAAEWNAFVDAGIPLATTEVIWLGAGDVRSASDVDAIIAAGPAYLIAAVSVPMSGAPSSPYVGQYLSTKPGLNFWWGHQDGNLTAALADYQVSVVLGG